MTANIYLYVTVIEEEEEIMGLKTDKNDKI